MNNPALLMLIAAVTPLMGYAAARLVPALARRIEPQQRDSEPKRTQ